MVTPGKDRQAAFKSRMREAGKRPLTIWADPEQEIAIKALLSGGALPVVTGNAQRIVDVEAREQAVVAMEVGLVERQASLSAAEQALTQEREKKIESLKVEIGHYRVANKELQVRLQAVDRQFKDLQEREKNLAERERQAGLLTGKKAPALTSKARAEALVDQFTTLTSYGTGKKYELDTSWDINRRLEQLTSMTRQAKASGTALQTLRGSFEDLISPQERDIISEASRVLSDLGKAATHAKEVVERKVKQLKRAEEARTAAAESSVEQAFAGLDLANQLCLIIHRLELSRGVELWTAAMKEAITSGRYVEYKLEAGLQEAFDGLRHETNRMIKGGMPAMESAQSLREKFNAERANIAVQCKDLIQLTQAALVQLAIQKAAKPS